MGRWYGEVVLQQVVTVQAAVAVISDGRLAGCNQPIKSPVELETSRGADYHVEGYTYILVADRKVDPLYSLRMLEYAVGVTKERWFCGRRLLEPSHLATEQSLRRPSSPWKIAKD
ncbi:hypothetical protein J6590_015656 [Homalodisca vitripennis]|nr:hypothetical protein J6590_015656 [Homalodisca vitripennis]